ncbi:unnamed protein product [Prunus brigantina]
MVFCWKKCRPPLELTRTQKKIIRRQYCTFLKNRDDTQMEYDGELDEETEAFGAELESLLQGDLGINMVFILPEKFRAAKGQESTLEGDVFSQESFECRLAEAEEAPKQQTPTTKIGRTAMKLATEQLCFSKPTKEMANHLRPLFITANFRGVPIPKVMVDGGAAINLLPHRLLNKMGRTENDLIPTRLTVTNFAGGITKTHGILDVDVIVRTKELKITFFVVDTTSTTYSALLGRDWIHQSLCVPSTLHQQLALWNEEGYMEIVEADPRPFLTSAMCFEARYYHDDLMFCLCIFKKGQLRAGQFCPWGLLQSLRQGFPPTDRHNGPITASIGFERNELRTAKLSCTEVGMVDFYPQMIIWRLSTSMGQNLVLRQNYIRKPQFWGINLQPDLDHPDCARSRQVEGIFQRGHVKILEQMSQNCRPKPDIGVVVQCFCQMPIFKQNCGKTVRKNEPV